MKKKFLIASHGELAKGLQSSLHILAGKGDEVTIINAYMSDEDFTPIIVDFIKSVAADEQGIIFTDLFGGSVNQKAVTEVLTAKANNIFVVSNANLPAVLALMLSAEECFTEEIIEKALSEAQVTLVKTQINQATEEDDFF